MGLFTSSQANACTIIRLEKRVAGSDVRWVADIVDADKNNYEIVIESLDASASKSDIKSAISSQLLEMDKLPAAVQTVMTEINASDDKGLGETIG